MGQRNHLLNATNTASNYDRSLDKILSDHNDIVDANNGLPASKPKKPKLSLDLVFEHTLKLYEFEGRSLSGRRRYEFAKQAFLSKPPVSAKDAEFKKNFKKWVTVFTALTKSDEFKTLKPKEQATLWGQIREGKATRQKWEAEMAH